MDGTSVGTYVKSPLSGRMDFFQALTGVILALFTLMHLVFVSTVIISPSIMDGLAWLLEELYLVQIFGPLLFFAMIVHFVIAARKMPFQVGTLPIFIKHSREMKHVDTWAWLVQVVTAIIVLVMASIHIYVILDSLPISAVESAAREQGGWTPFYLVFLVSVGLHLTIGLFRVGVKFGLITEANRTLWKKRADYLVLGYIALGILAIIRFHFVTIG